MPKKKTLTEDTPKESYATTDEENAFLERIAKASAAAETGGMEGGDVLEFVVDEKIVGEFSHYEVVESTKKLDADGNPRSFKMICLKTEKGNQRYWSFGLLDHMMKKWDAKPGDIIVVMKKPKNSEGFWGGEFMRAPASDDK